MKNNQKTESNKINSLECEFHNSNWKSKKIELKYLLEAKPTTWILNIVTLGCYSGFQWALRTRLIDKYDAKLQKEKKEFEKEEYRGEILANKNKVFESSYIQQINNGFSKSIKLHTTSNKKLYLLNICWRVLATISTAGIYLLWILYQEIENKKLFDNLHYLSISNDKQKERLMKERGAASYKREARRIQKVNDTLKEVDDFNLDISITNSLNNNSNNLKKKNLDPFTLFLFYTSYLILGIVTLGGFFVYLAVQKYVYKVDYNFFNHFLTKEVIDKSDFNERLQTLSNKKDNFDFSKTLIASFNYKSSLTDYNSLFKSVFFKQCLNRFLTVLFLTIITCGLFPLWIIYKYTFHSAVSFSFLHRKKVLKPVTLEQQNWFIKKWKIKFKAIYDFGFDLKLATALSTEKVLNVRSNIKLSPTRKDLGIFFIKVITSPIFKWLFTLATLLIVYVLGSIWVMHYQYDTSAPIFYVFSILSIFFFLSLSYHIFLFF